MIRPPPTSPLFPYTTLFRSPPRVRRPAGRALVSSLERSATDDIAADPVVRSEEHTSELQSHVNLVCRLLLEKKTAAHEHLITTVTHTPSVRVPRRCARPPTG